MRREVWKDLGIGAGLGLLAEFFFYGDHVAPALVSLCGTAELALTVQLLCFLGFGVSFGLTALLWKRERWSFPAKTLCGFALAALGLGCWVLALHGWPWPGDVAGGWLGGSIALFVLDWVVRFLDRRRAVEAIRAGLGLPTPPPSLLKWRETLPDLVLAAVLYLGLRPLLELLDARDVPLFTALLLPWLLWPFIAAVMGFGTGLRCGVTPLVPLAVGLAFLPNLLYTKVPYDWQQAAVYAALALAGNLLGAMVRREKTADTGNQTLPPAD